MVGAYVQMVLLPMSPGCPPAPSHPPPSLDIYEPGLEKIEAAGISFVRQVELDDAPIRGAASKKSRRDSNRTGREGLLGVLSGRT